MLKKLFTFFFLSILVLLFVRQPVNAAGSLAVRIEQPKSPTNQSSFNLVFVTLDIEGRPITVKCYEKGPADGAFTQFAGNIDVSAGGNTGNCPVDSSILNTNGTYQFYAVATAGSDTAVSATDTVDFNTSGPGTPSDFNKSKINSCEYKIAYKTADDGGKTVKVELYRSDSNTFSADSGTRVDSHSIGSNSTDSFTNSVPDCNKEYFYVLRAFDSFGNGSGLVGDASVTITTTTTANTSVEQVAPASGAIAVASANGNGNVLGQEGVKTTPESQNNPQEEVKGAKTQTPEAKSAASEFTFKNALIFGFLAIVIAFITYYIYSRRKKV